MSRILKSVIKRIFPALLAVCTIAVYWSCSEGVTDSVPTECIVTIEVTGVTATADIVYYDQADNPMVEILNDPGVAVPYSRQITEAIDYTGMQNRQVSVTTDVGVGETLNLIVYYDEIYQHPPETIRTTLVQEEYENPGATPVNNHTLNVNFALPVQ